MRDLPLGVILAGGRARRMGGGDKALLPLGGQPLLSRVIARFSEQVASLALNANGDPRRFESYGLPVLADPLAGYLGPLAGVLAGMDWAAAQGRETLVTIAADTPFFPADLTARLVAAADGQRFPLVLAATPAPEEGAERAPLRSARAGLLRHPAFALWPSALREDLRAALQGGLSKVVLWSERHGGREALFDDERAFFNINTPEDLRIAEGML